MIFGIGTDIVEIARIANTLENTTKFAPRILTEFELAEFSASKFPERYLAKKFAAKEALVKAMGTGISGGISWHMAQVLHTDKGKPYFEVFGDIDEFFATNGITNCQLSIADEQAYATAYVVLEQN